MGSVASKEKGKWKSGLCFPRVFPFSSAHGQRKRDNPLKMMVVIPVQIERVF
jgi:hypothetical protein